MLLTHSEADASGSGSLPGIAARGQAVARRVHRRLRRVLKAKGMKQSELARRLGVSPVVVSRVLKNPERSTGATLR
ncbi:MAG: helix-turn-helix transcriptional regulator [Planctomycetota bacterium]